MTLISKNIRVRHPSHFVIGDHSIVDDFCYFSTKVEVGRFSHIASGCSIAGGRERLFKLGDYCSLSSGVKVWCTSDDFVNDIVTVLPGELGDSALIKDHLIVGDVIMEDCTAVGANSVVMPRNHIPEGTVVGALSFVPVGFPFKPWSVYAGIPIRLIGKRNKKNVIRQLEWIRKSLKRLGRKDG